MWSCRERWYHDWELWYLGKDKVLHVDSLSRSASCIRMFVNAFAVFVSPVSLLGLATLRWMCKTADLYWVLRVNSALFRSLLQGRFLICFRGNLFHLRVFTTIRLVDPTRSQ
jgi:hypothetical protein